ncbi:hypothetical protein F5888DRAFT_1800576 [Russula emetica]|nr:hypothetical protein F5888DRAFT_1800576 [Russula emetica]
MSQGLAKDETATSETLSRWDPRDGWSGSNESPQGPEPSEESDPEPRPNSPWSETGSETESTGSNHNSPSRPSSSISSAGSTHAYPPPGWGNGMASHDAIADGDQLLLPAALTEARPLSPDHSPPHQTLTEASSGSTILSSYPSDSHSYSTGSGTTGSGSEAEAESETFLSKLLKGTIKARTVLLAPAL